MWGGVVSAYDMEWKIRQFVIEVINYALIQKKDYLQKTGELPEDLHIGCLA